MSWGRFGNDLHIKSEDIPIGVGPQPDISDLSHRLPNIAKAQGYELNSYSNYRGTHIAVIRNQYKQIVYQWPDDFVPDWVDAMGVCKKIGIL